MGSNEPLAQLPVGGAYHAAPVVALDAGFESRWAAWVERGQVHDRLVRRRLVVLAGVASMGAAVVYAFIR